MTSHVDLNDYVIDIVLWEHRHERGVKKRFRLSWVHEFLRFQDGFGQKVYQIRLFHPETGETRIYRVDDEEYFRANRLWRKAMNGDLTSEAGIVHHPR